MDSIVDARLTPNNPSYFSDIFVRMMWAVDHKNFDVVRVFEDWLSECTDQYRIEIVLRNDEVFPFVEDEEFHQAIELVVKTMPEIAHLCDKMLKARAKPQ